MCARHILQDQPIIVSNRMKEVNSRIIEVHGWDMFKDLFGFEYASMGEIMRCAFSW